MKTIIFGVGNYYRKRKEKLMNMGGFEKNPFELEFSNA